MILHVLIGVCLMFTQHVLSSSDTQQQPLPTEAEQQQNAIKNAFEYFAARFAQSVAKSQSKQNYVVSPLSVYAAFSLATLGAEGDTKNELAKALGLEKENLDKAHQVVGSLLKEAQSLPNSKLHIADGVFVNSNIKLNEQYQKNVKLYYDSIVESLDFSDGGKKATDTVNQWVSQHTNGRIPKLYDETIDPQIVALLVSALYFEAEWEYQFPVTMTKKNTFYGLKSNEEVDFMENLKVIPYYHHEKYSAIGIPYKQNEAIMYIVLPNANDTLESMAKNFTINDFRSIIHDSHTRYVDYTIPKLKLKFSNVLNDIVRKLGIEKAFDRSKADFSNLGVNAYIDHVIHKAELEVTEFGTIGSAATSIGMFPMTMPIPFTANKPFIFAIYQKKSGAIIFTGAVYSPLAG